MSLVDYRYIDWPLTVPLQMIDFKFNLKATGKRLGVAMFMGAPPDKEQSIRGKTETSIPEGTLKTEFKAKRVRDERGN